MGNGFVLENLEQWNASWLRQSHLAHRQMYRLMMLMAMLMVMIVDFDFDLSSVWSCPHSVRGALAKGSLCKVQDHKRFLSENLWELWVKLTSAAFSTLNSNLDERS